MPPESQGPARAEARARLDQLWKRGTDFFGCRYAILGGAMSWLSERHLVSAISNAGGFGMIACGAMTPALLDTEIAETAKRTTQPFGVNLITMHPDLEALIDVCLRHKVTHVALAGGLPPGSAITRLKDGGAKVIAFAPALAIAKRTMNADTEMFRGIGNLGNLALKLYYGTDEAKSIANAALKKRKTRGKKKT